MSWNIKYVLTGARRLVAPLPIAVTVHYSDALHDIPIIACVRRGGTTGRSSGCVVTTVNLWSRSA